MFPSDRRKIGIASDQNAPIVKRCFGDDGVISVILLAPIFPPFSPSRKFPLLVQVNPSMLSKLHHPPAILLDLIRPRPLRKQLRG
jgi:hypothetical protein